MLGWSNQLVGRRILETFRNQCLVCSRNFKAGTPTDICLDCTGKRHEEAEETKRQEEEQKRQAAQLRREQALLEEQRAKEEAARIARENTPIFPCADCGRDISRRAVKCVHCGAPNSKTKSAQAATAAGIGGLGGLVLLVFLFYDTTRNDVHNLGLLMNRICGTITGLFLVTWSLILRVAK